MTVHLFDILVVFGKLLPFDFVQDNASLCSLQNPFLQYRIGLVFHSLLSALYFSTAPPSQSHELFIRGMLINFLVPNPLLSLSSALSSLFFTFCKITCQIYINQIPKTMNNLFYYPVYTSFL